MYTRQDRLLVCSGRKGRCREKLGERYHHHHHHHSPAGRKTVLVAPLLIPPCLEWTSAVLPSVCERNPICECHEPGHYRHAGECVRPAPRKPHTQLLNRASSASGVCEERLWLTGNPRRWALAVVAQGYSLQGCWLLLPKKHKQLGVPLREMFKTRHAQNIDNSLRAATLRLVLHGIV